MENYLAFLDESGGHGFDFSKEGTPTHFVVCAVIIEESKLEQVKKDFERIKSYYFPISELKSSKIGSNDAIRTKIISEIKGLDFRYFHLVVDKREIYSDSGLQYKEIFYKFLYGLLYNNLYRTIRNLSVYADQMVSQDFLIGFKQYVEQNHMSDLFHQSIQFSRSKSTILLQLADFIGGTLFRYYSDKSPIDINQELVEKKLGEVVWPAKYQPYTVDEEDIDDEYKEVISELALLRIKNYLVRNRNNSDPLTVKRKLFVNYLRMVFLYNNKTRFIYTDEIIKHIENNTGDRIKEQYFRQQIVGPLRTEGLLISSNVNGYKIPCSKADIYTFFNLFSKVINPMVHRLQLSYEALYQATNGKFDVLDHPEYEYLKKLIQ